MSRWITLSIAALTLAVLGACVGGPKVVEPKPVVKSIAIIPALSPGHYSVDGRSAAAAAVNPLGVLFQDPERRQKEQVFAQRMPDPNFQPGAQFTNAVAQALRDLGYRVEVLENIPRYPEDPDDVDYAKLTYTADAVLHLYFRVAGIHSSPLGRNYVPRLNAGATLMAKGYSKNLYKDTTYYGYEADPTDPVTSIVANTKYRYANFDAVLNNLGPLRSAYAEGIQASAKLTAVRIHAALK